MSTEIETTEVVGSATFLGVTGSAEDLLQRFFDLTLQNKDLESQLKTMRPAVLELLNELSPRTVNGGSLTLSMRMPPAEYDSELFDLLDIEQIKACAKFQATAIRSAGLMADATPFLLDKPMTPVINCTKSVGSSLVSTAMEDSDE